MAGRFTNLQEAAQKLGITPDQVNEMRERGEIHGYRDGASWKFKADDIDRVAAEMKSAGGQAKGTSPEDDDFDDLVSAADVTDMPEADDEDHESDSSILVSEVELGHSEETTSSTIIGKSSDQQQAAADSDLQLASTASDIKKKEEADEAAGSPEGGEKKKDSDVTLVPGSGSDSDVALVAGGSKDESSKDESSQGDSDLSLDPSNVGTDSELALGFLEGDDDSLQLQPATSSGLNLSTSKSTSDLQLPGSEGSDVLTGTDMELQSPSGSGTGDIAPGGGSSDLGLGSDVLELDDEDLALAEDDDDLVLGEGSSRGSESALGADSGINLAKPSDSGLSLEDEPLDVTGSSISSLELPEDEDVIELEDEADEATQLQQDEDFQLSPSAEGAGDESDSGSQVIALEDSATFDEDAATMVQEGPLVAEEGLGAGESPAFSPVGAPAGATYPGQPQAETPYSVWNVLGLLLIVLLLSLTGMLMMDVVRNMWSWGGTFTATTALMEGIVDALGF